ALSFRKTAAPAKPQILEAEVQNERKRVTVQRARKWVPSRNHPWREAARRGAQKRALREAAVAPRPALALRCALNAPPYGLRRATLRTSPTKWGDAVGRPRCESSFLGHPDAKFFEKKGVEHQERKKAKRKLHKRGKNPNTKRGHF